uniref:Odorant receptor n=1 Tax=Glossina austeni TaxID=7395 RepID=A0A1A9V011_GLOAU
MKNIEKLLKYFVTVATCRNYWLVACWLPYAVCNARTPRAGGPLWLYAIEINALIAYIRKRHSVELRAHTHIAFIMSQRIKLITCTHMWKLALHTERCEYVRADCASNVRQYKKKGNKKLKHLLVSKGVKRLCIRYDDRTTHKQKGKFYKVKMSFLDRYRKFIGAARVLARFCACDMFDETYTVFNPFFMVLLLCLAIYTVCFVYTIYDGFVINNDWTIILQCLTIGAMILQAISKYTCYYIHRITLREVVKHLDEIYAEYQNRGTRYEYALNRSLQKIVKCSKITGITYFTSLAGLIVLPIIYMLITGKRELTLTALIPGIDSKETFGYFVHTGFHSVIILFSGVGFFASDMFMFSIFLHVLLHRDIMTAKFHDLNEATAKQNEPAERSRDLLNDVIAWHQKYNLFMEYIEELFSGVIFVHVTTSCVSICSTLFCIVLKVWPFAPLLLISNTSMYAYCGFGQLLATTKFKFGLQFA